MRQSKLYTQLEQKTTTIETNLATSFSPEQLIGEHAGKDADEDADDGEAEEGAEAGVEDAVDDLAVGSPGEDEAKGG